MALDSICVGAGRDFPGPTNQAGDAKTSFRGRALFTAEWGIATIGPKQKLIAVVGGIDDNRVARDAKVLNLLEDGAYLLVMLDHLGSHNIFFGTPLIHRFLEVLFRDVRPDVNCSRVEAHKERFVTLSFALHPVERLLENLGVDILHALAS